MSIFGNILGKIFGSVAPGAATASMAGPSASTTPAGNAPAASSPQAAPVGAPTAARPAPMQAVDVAKVLDALEEDHDEDLDWRKSIVDLMKLLDIDSGLAARRELAQELGYTGSTKDTATMNVWLHKQVMTKLAENGGKVPAELQ